MEKLRKGAAWLWHNKERVLLIILVVIGIYRLYVVINPQIEVEPAMVRAPVPEPPPELIPPPPPNQPLGDAPRDYEMLVSENPFWYYAGDRETGGPEAENPGIELLRMTEVNGNYRVQLQLPGGRDWMEEGDTVGEFELLAINPESETVEVEWKRNNESYTLSMD